MKLNEKDSKWVLAARLELANNSDLSPEVADSAGAAYAVSMAGKTSTDVALNAMIGTFIHAAKGGYAHRLVMDMMEKTQEYDGVEIEPRDKRVAKVINMQDFKKTAEA